MNPLAYVVPLAFASGLNLYATVAVLGVTSRYDRATLPEQFKLFGHPAVIGVALVLYLIEFVADKVPWFDSLWDTVHTVVRPLGGAFVAVTAVGAASPLGEMLAALLGGSVALTTHLGKAGTRVAANTSPEPFSNWALSLFEDGLAIGLTWLALEHPYVALTVAIVLLAILLTLVSVLMRAFRGWRQREPLGS
jgi:Domain of unknown function (DUF4126)